MGRTPSKLALVLLGTLGVVGFTACKNGGKGKSSLAEWVDEPSTAQKSGNTFKFPDLQVQFELPETLYVFKDCGEASHTPDGATKWVPVITCRSGGSAEYEFGQGSEEEEEDPFAEEEAEEASGAESIDLTVFVTHKTRPIDERSVTWFENKYKQAGLDIQELTTRAHRTIAGAGPPTR